MEVTEPVKNWVQKKTEKLEKYVPRLVESHVIVKKEKYLCIAELTVLGRNLRVYGEGRDKDNLFTAIDQAVDRVTKQLKKIREKVKNHHVHAS